MSTLRLALLASPTDEAQAALATLSALHPLQAPEDADVIVALGGDGFMLQTLHRHGALGKPVYGMKLGTVGFLMNQYRPEELRERIAKAEPAVLHPLEMLAQTESGTTVGSLAYNEVSLLRQTRQAAHVSIELNGDVRLDELICDGVMLATPAGSTAYNFSANGPILHPAVPGIALVPLCPHALSNRPITVSDGSRIEIVLHAPHRARVHADGQEKFDIEAGDHVSVARSARSIRFLHPLGYSYFAMLREKLHWSETPRRY